MHLHPRLLAGALALSLPLAAAPLAPTATAETDPVLCGTPENVTLFAGQTIDTGSVVVGNDDTNLYVTFDTTDPWAMTESHVHVADTREGIPQTRKGNPQVGQFAYQSSYEPPVTSDTYVIPLSTISLDENGQVVVAAHAVVGNLNDDGSVTETETGWADGTRFVDRGSWATYFQYSVQECEAEPPGPESKTETAFARFGDANTCFLNIDANGDGAGDFNRWGWTNGPLDPGTYEMELWAGAGRCDVSKGTLVGTVTVEYTGETVRVTFTTTGTNPDTGLSYNMADAHAYVGSDILAANNGQFTVAPGQYPQINSEANGATVQTFTFTGVNGPIHVVAHASVDGFAMD